MNKRTKDEDSDRRSKGRFPIVQPLRYKILNTSAAKETGVGTTLNISSRGVWFTTDRALSVGMLVELSMNWPARLNDVCPLKLMIFGRIVRSNAEVAGLAIERYEFRTQASGPLPAYAPPVSLSDEYAMWIE